MNDEAKTSDADKYSEFGYRLKEERSRHQSVINGRKRRKMTQDDLAEQMGVSRGLVSRVESGSRPPSLDFAISADQALGTGRLFQNLLPTPEHEVNRSLSRYVTTEQTEAERLLTWQPSVIPALLQTADYARAVRGATFPQYSKAEIDKIVAAQEKRQGALTRETPLSAHFVLAEAAARTLVGGRTVMVRQWRRLIEWAALPSVTIQVLPVSMGAHSSMQGAYTILDMPPQAPHTGQAALYVETTASGSVITEPQQISYARHRFGTLMAHAMSPPETSGFLQQLQLQEKEETAWR